MVLNLNENQEWLSYVRSSIEPILELEKGKLCQEEERDKSSDNNSDNNIFDDDFMRSDFGLEGSGPNDIEKNGNLLKSPEKRTEGDEDEDDENDHQKFFKKMQECFSSSKSLKTRKSSDHIDIDER